MSDKSGSSSAGEEECSYNVSTPLLSSSESDTGVSFTIPPEEEQMVTEPSPEIASQEPDAVEPATSGSSTATAGGVSEQQKHDCKCIRHRSRYFCYLYNKTLQSVSGSVDGRPKLTYANGRGGTDSDDSSEYWHETLYVPTDGNSSESHTFDSDDDYDSEKEKSDDTTEKPSGSREADLLARYSRYPRDSSPSDDTSGSKSSCSC